MLTYHPIDAVTSQELLALLNDPAVRRHLIEHPLFTEQSALDWAAAKAAEDALPGCRIRAIRDGATLAGWGGIQRHDGVYELAIVLAPAYWRHGAAVMSTMKRWAAEAGHQQLVIHLPQSRPQQRAIAKLLGQPVHTTTIGGQAFNTYHIPIAEP